MLKPGCDFHFDEMVWRNDSGLIEQAMTELTAIADDAEFERQMCLIRLARSAAGLGNGRLLQSKTAFCGEVIQRRLALGFRRCLLLIDGFFRFAKYLRNIFHVLFGKRFSGDV